MLQVLNRQFKGWVVAIALALSTLFLSSTAAQAAIAVSLDSSNATVNVATVYKVNKTDRATVLSKVVQSSQSTLPQAPGFLNVSILNGQDENQIVALSQWKDLPSFQTYTAQQTQNKSGNVPSQVFACQVQHTETRNTAPSFSKGDTIMLSQFKIKPGKDQSELAAIIPQMMPGAFQTIPGLQWAAMCPSTDKSTIALLARWSSRDDFASLGQEAGYDKETNYWQDYANNEHGLYDVVETIASNV